VSPNARPRFGYGERLALALTLCKDPALDVLISGETGFSELPAQLGDLLNNPDTLCHRVRYEA
jgi:hypothetical protein